MKKIIVCKSVHQGNTDKIAKVMSSVLDAVVMKPEEIDPENIGKCDIIGFGSGIYAGRHHRSVVSLVKNLPEGKGKKVFVFSTSGKGTGKYNDPLKKLLASRGHEVIGTFTCKGYDTFGPLKLFGGINKGKPDETDIEAARQFALEMKNIKI